MSIESIGLIALLLRSIHRPSPRPGITYALFFNKSYIEKLGQEERCVPFAHRM